MSKLSRSRSALIVATFFVFVTGCMTGPKLVRFDDEHSNLEPGSDAWWAQKATLPPGVRQKVHKGKVWPPVPRSTCEPQQFSHTYYDAHYWPLPYVCQDRAFVRGVWNDQMANGWTQATTLYDYHFDPDTDELTHPGERHLEWILYESPEQRRVVYIQSTLDRARNELREAHVRSRATEMNPESGAPAIIVRYTRPVGRPASEIQALRDAEIRSLPSPRLSSMQGGGGGGGSTGGGSAPAGGGGL